MPPRNLVDREGGVALVARFSLLGYRSLPVYGQARVA